MARPDGIESDGSFSACESTLVEEMRRLGSLGWKLLPGVCLGSS